MALIVLMCIVFSIDQKTSEIQSSRKRLQEVVVYEGLRPYWVQFLSYPMIEVFYSTGTFVSPGVSLLNSKRFLTVFSRS